MKLRTITINWNDQRNNRRLHRWLNLASDFQGMLYRHGLPVGFKTGRAAEINFNFYDISGSNQWWDKKHLKR